MSFGDPSDLVTRSIRLHRRFFLAEGAILIVLGAVAIVAPMLAGLAVTVLLGWLFLVAGFAGLVFTLGARGAPGFSWALLSAVIALFAGGILIWDPVAGLVTLTYVLAAYFLVDGVLTIMLALQHQRDLTGRWQWLLVNGVVDLVLAILIISGLPGASAWALGVLLGIDLLFGGVSLIGIALAARR